MQVILNLLRNASQSMKEQSDLLQPQIILRAQTLDNQVKMEVEDNGPGIKDDIQKHIFEPFFTTKPVGQGTGLRLSVSYMIVTSNHNGSMEVESELGKGTKFTVCIPIT